MNIEVIPTDIRSGPLAKFLVRYPRHPAYGSYIWLPATVSRELVEDLLNDELRSMEAAPCDQNS